MPRVKKIASIYSLVVETALVSGGFFSDGGNHTKPTFHEMLVRATAGIRFSKVRLST